MAAARLLGLAGGRLRTATAAMGPRLAPLAPHAGRRCPLAPALLGASAPRLLRRAPMPVKLHPFGTKEAGADKTQEAGADITGETAKATKNKGVYASGRAKDCEAAGRPKDGSGRAKDCYHVTDAAGCAKEDGSAAASDGHITMGGGGGGGDSKPDGSATATGEPDHKSASNEGNNDGEGDKPASTKLLLSFAKVVETVLTNILQTERYMADKLVSVQSLAVFTNFTNLCSRFFRKSADDQFQDHFRRIVHLILAGVLLELILVVAAAMVIATWLRIMKMKEILNYLTTSPESMEMYIKVAGIAVNLLYDAFMGKGRKMIASVLSLFIGTEEAIAREETKSGEEAKLGEPKMVENGKPAGEDGASDRVGEEGAGSGEGVVLMLMIFAMFVF